MANCPWRSLSKRLQDYCPFIRSRFPTLGILLMQAAVCAGVTWPSLHHSAEVKACWTGAKKKEKKKKKKKWWYPGYYYYCNQVCFQPRNFVCCQHSWNLACKYAVGPFTIPDYRTTPINHTVILSSLFNSLGNHIIWIIWMKWSDWRLYFFF